MKLRAALPKQELNGMTAVHGDAVGHVGKAYLVVALVRVVESTTAIDKSREAKFSLERIETVGEDAQPYIAELLETTFEERTGKTPLDLDIPGVDDLRKTFKPAGSGRGRKKPDPTLLREPDALTATPAPVLVDTSLMTPEEQAEAEGVIDAEVEEDDAAAGDAAPEWEQAGSTSSDPDWTSGYPEGHPADEHDEDEAASSATTPSFSG